VRQASFCSALELFYYPDVEDFSAFRWKRFSLKERKKQRSKGRVERTAARHHTQQSLSPHRDFKERSVVLAPSRRPHPSGRLHLSYLYSHSRRFFVPLLSFKQRNFFKKRNAENAEILFRCRCLCQKRLQVPLPWLPLACCLSPRPPPGATQREMRAAPARALSPRPTTTTAASPCPAARRAATAAARAARSENRRESGTIGLPI